MAKTPEFAEISPYASCGLDFHAQLNPVLVSLPPCIAVLYPSVFAPPKKSGEKRGLV